MAREDRKGTGHIMTQPELPKIQVAYPDEVVDIPAVFSQPTIDPTAWVAPNAVVLGRVTIKARASVWYNCVVRGDYQYIEIGEETNVQDGSVLHVDHGFPCILGNRVSLGHNAIVHASVVKDGALIAIGATVLTGCEIGEGAIIAAGAVVMEKTKVPPHTLWAGCPAKQLKELTQAQRDRVAMTYKHYVNNGAVYLARYGRAHIDALTAR
jgi:carbonic anhydrase/acetyltransferase-like protein (isoleucine patch superfamily)